MVQTRNTLLAKERLRSYRRNEGEVSRRFSVQAHGCKSLRLLQVAAAKRTLNRYEQNRNILTALLRTAHEKHPSHGYHRLALDVFSETGWVFSHNLAHKCCKAAGIHSKARKRRYQRPGEESILFANEVKGRWNATQPLQIVVSDMTMFKVGNTYWEWTILLDTFNNEILAHSVTSQAGSNRPYYHCLEELKKQIDKEKSRRPKVVLHTDQGAVYSSQAFCQAHHNYNILRSMSRGGTPTDNPIMEALTAGSKKSSISTLIWLMPIMSLLSWITMSASSIPIDLLPWVTKAPFSTGLNGASPKLFFCVYFSLDKCSHFFVAGSFVSIEFTQFDVPFSLRHPYLFVPAATGAESG